MSLLQYFKLRDGLPDPKGPPCNSIALNAMAMADREVELEKEIAKKKKHCLAASIEGAKLVTSFISTGFC